MPPRILLLASLLVLGTPAFAQQAPNTAPDLALGQRLFDVMSHNNPEVLPGRRVNHAKGAVYSGTFTATPDAAMLSTAPHLQGQPVPMVIRFSLGGGVIAVPDKAVPVHGMAMTFQLPDGRSTDLMCINMPVFVSPTPEEFIAFNEAAQASPPGSPAPTALQRFIGSHPAAQRFVAGLKPMPQSFGTESYFAIHAYRLTNAAGETRNIRWRIVPEAGYAARSAEEAAASPPNALFDELEARTKTGPVAFRLEAQIGEPGDPTNNATIAWPEERRVVNLGRILVTGAVPNTAEAEKPIGFLPGKELPGLARGDDPFFAARDAVYAVAFARRNP
jgi:catalase